MSHIAKYVVAPILVISFIVTVTMWVTPGIEGLEDRTNQRIRLVATSTTLAALCAVIWAICRKDRVPDYLRANVDHCFERKGLCFTVLPYVHDGVFALFVLYQNRYSGACTAKIVLARSHVRGLDEALVIPVECAAAGFGMIRMPFAVPSAGQGQTYKFRVYADVTFPSGRGRMVRFKEGSAVGGTRADRNNLLLTFALLPLGVAHWTTPASIAVDVPAGVADALTADQRPTSQTFWRLGEPVKNIQVRF